MPEIQLSPHLCRMLPKGRPVHLVWLGLDCTTSRRPLEPQPISKRDMTMLHANVLSEVVPSNAYYRFDVRWLDGMMSWKWAEIQDKGGK